jgi:hypothetical protein
VVTSSSGNDFTDMGFGPGARWSLRWLDDEACCDTSSQLITREGNAAVVGKFRPVIEACRLSVSYVAMISLTSGPAPDQKQLIAEGRLSGRTRPKAGVGLVQFGVAKQT